MQHLQPNSTLQGGKYKIEKVLGQGGFGITYLAEQVMLGRKVAVKEFFMKELCDRDESTSHVTLGTEGSRETVNRFREKFLKEARNIARLNHPNIVRIIDVFEENGTAYYVMEYAENGSLADKVKRDGYLSEPVATRYILQVAEALDYVHQQKMNHLDVKPANIMLNEKDESVLIDFGLSKQYDATTGSQTSTTPVGISEGYAPMEQYKQGGVGEFSPETDIYALGATFFKLLTGKTPPSASDVNEDGVPVDELKAKGVSDNAIAVICKSMEGRKRDRMKSVRAFAEGSQTQVPETQSSNFISNNEETIICNNEEPRSFDLNTFKIDVFDLSNPKVVEDSANVGNNESMFKLAIMYLRGEGKFADERKAYEWLTRCARNGDERAMNILADWKNISVSYQASKENYSTSPQKQSSTIQEKDKERNSDVLKKICFVSFLAFVVILVLGVLMPIYDTKAAPNDTTSDIASYVEPLPDDEMLEDDENVPRFPGGCDALMTWLQQNVKYPDSARKKGVQGRVLVEFVVEKDGSISNIEVIRSVDADLDREAIRVINLMPQWIPAKQRGKAVRENYVLPISFVLQ